MADVHTVYLIKEQLKMQSLAVPTSDILGFPVADVDMREAVAAMAALLDDAPGARIVTANAEIMYLAHRDPALGRLLHSAAMIVADGVGVVKAAGKLGRPIKAKVAGVELMQELCAWAAAHGRSVFLLGAGRASVEGAAAALQASHPDLPIAGFHDGYFDEAKKEAILAEIQEKRPDFLFVALGFPAQDLFYENNKDRLPVGVMMGVGGSFDVLSGQVQRAPKWAIQMGMEWAYRYAQNPRRLKRAGAIPGFMLAVRRQKARESRNSS